MRLIIKFFWAFLAPYLLVQIFGAMVDNGSTLRLVFKIMKSNNSLSVTQTTVSAVTLSDAVTMTSAAPTVDEINTGPEKALEAVKQSRKQIEAINEQIQGVKIAMKSEIATISSKLGYIETSLQNHTNTQMNLNYELLDLKALIATIAIKQEKIDYDLTSSRAMLKKLEAKEKLLPGHAAAKAAENHPVHHSKIAFLAQRFSDYSAVGKIIPYERNELNFGDAFNKTTGVFRAPLKGMYHFYFSALKMKRETSGTSRLTVQLKKIGNPEAVLAQSHINSFDWYDWHPVTFQATVDLDKDSLVGVQLMEGAIYQSSDERHPLTSFGGFLVSPAN